MKPICVHLVWASVVVTCWAQACYAIVVIMGRHDTLALVGPSLLSLAGPIMGLIGVTFAARGQGGQPPAGPQ